MLLGSRNQSKGNSASDANAELQQEILRLQRQYRQVEDDRRSYKEYAEYTLCKQQESINSLNREHGELAKDMWLADSKRNQLSDDDNLSILKELLETEQGLNEELGTQHCLAQKIEEEISSRFQQVELLRQEMGGCHTSELKHKTTQKLILVLQNRLDQANVRFNLALAENATYRQQIDHIAVQRNRFEDLHVKLTECFRKGENEKKEIVDKSTMLFHNRDEAHHRMQSLKERRDRDLASFNTESKDLFRIIDHERKLKEFMSTKAEERGEIFERAVRKRREKQARDNVRSLEEKVLEYEEIFLRLREVSRVDDPDEMVSIYLVLEQNNFAMFSYVNDQNVQLQHLEDAVQILRNDKQRVEGETTTTQIAVDAELASLEKLAEFSRQDLQTILTIEGNDNKLLHLIIPTVQRISEKLNTMKQERLCDSKVTEENVSHFIGVIEKQANELLEKEYTLAVHDGNNDEVKDIQSTANKALKVKLQGIKAGVPSIQSEMILDLDGN